MQIEPRLYLPKDQIHHITQTLTDCTPTQLDREPATPLLTPTPADSNPVSVDTTPSPPQSTQTRAVSKGTAVPKARGPPLRIPTPNLRSGSVAMVHTPLLLHYCIYSYQLFSILKDGIETPMAQQVCFNPVSLTGLLL